MQNEIINLKAYMHQIGSKAHQASSKLASANTIDKDDALLEIHQQLSTNRERVLLANQIDLKKGRENNLDPSLLDRLELTESRFENMLQGLKDVINLPDPIGEISNMTYRPSGIQLGKMRVPLGVIGMIYESRPNVTLEAASLAIKSGNAIILRGGKEAFETNQAIAHCIRDGLSKSTLPSNSVQVITTIDRQAVSELITMKQFVDVIIPRGGKGLITRIDQEASIPVIKHLDGNCHTYIDDFANPEIAINVSVNAKTQRYGTCNTMETLLISKSVALDLLPKICTAMIATDDNMQFRVCENSMAILSTISLLDNHISQASIKDWDTEYLAPILAIKVVDDINDAINHINKHSSKHTDVIISDNYSHTQQFIREIDSSSVMINASSRFADGFEYGLGAEIGISTNKIHARGPVGLEGLTSQKWIVFGHGEIR